MACFKKLKCWKRAGNSKTGVIRSFLKCLLPCIRQKSRSPSPENSRNIEENSEDTTHGRRSAPYEAQIEGEMHQELIDMRQMTCEVETLPHSGQFDDVSFEETEQGYGRENKPLENCKETTHGRTSAPYEAQIEAEIQQELIDMRQMTCEVETLPHSGQFDDVSFEETEQGHGRENKTLENCKETTHGRTSAPYEAQIEAEIQQELIDMRQMTCEVETLPHSGQVDDVSFEETEQGHGRENKSLENCKATTHGLTSAQYEALKLAERQHELIDIRQMIREVEKSSHSAQFHGILFEENEQDHGREEKGLCLEDFNILEHLGKGGFGQVVLARKKSKGGHSSSKEVFALKLVPHKLECEVEKEILVRAVGHPFLVQLRAYFRTKESFCYVMEYCGGGSLHSLICRLQRFHVDWARFYAAEIILAVNFLHKCGIVHRDIKPGNILLDRDGHCKLADFGASQVGMFKGKRTEGVCGTKGYRAPEIQRGRLYGPEVDWWSVGRVMFAMMVEKFRPEDLHPERYPLRLTKDAESIINMFMETDPRHRLGARGDTRSILMHPFFKTVNWEAVLQKRVTPPVNPVTLEFLNEESGSDISFKSADEEAVLEGPPHRTQHVKCPALDQGASGKMKKLVMVAAAVVMVVVSFVLVRILL